MIQQSEDAKNQKQEENEFIPLKQRQFVSPFKIFFSGAGKFDIFICICAIIACIGVGITNPIIEFIIGQAIGILNPEHSISQIQDGIQEICLRFVYVGIISFVVGFFMCSLWYYFGKVTSHRIKIEYFKLIMEKDQSWFDTNANSAFELSNRIQVETDAIDSGIGIPVGTITKQIIVTITSIFISLILNLKLALVCLSIYPLWISFVFYLVKIVNKCGEEQRMIYQKVGGIAEETLYQIRTVASFANFEFEDHRFSENLKLSLKSGLKRALFTGISFGVYAFILVSCYMICFGYGSFLIYNKEMNSAGNHLLTAADIYITFDLLLYGALSIMEVFPSIKSVIHACSAAKGFFELRESTEKQRKAKSEQKDMIKPSLSSINGGIVFQNVTFCYPKKPNDIILENFSAEFEARKTTAIVGQSGCGKSTIINLIERLYDIKHGQILIDGIPINQINLEYYHSFIGYVSQEPVLFHDTIRNNITFGREGITEDEIIEACKKAQIYNFIKKLKEGLDYIVGVQGSKLSGGQKQRIAIARAIVQHPKIIILDEATSALDNLNENKVQAALNSIRDEVTVIIIAHRLSTIKNADKIIVLGKYGHIQEIGFHDSLLELNGLYAKLVAAQLYHPSEIKKYSMKAYQYGEDENMRMNASSSITSTKGDILELEETKSLEIPKKEIEKIAQTNTKKLFAILSQFKGHVTLATISAVISGCVFPVQGFLFGDGIARLSNPDIEVVKQEGITHSLYFLVIAVAAGISELFKNYSFEAIGEHLTALLRMKIFSKYLQFHMSFYDKNENSPGNLISSMNTNTSKINNIILSIIGVYIQAFVTIVICLIIALISDWRICLIYLGFIPVIIISSMLYHKIIEGNFESSESAQDGKILSECICNTMTIFCYSGQVKAVKLFRDSITASPTIKKRSMINGILYGVSLCTYFFSNAAIYYAGSSFILDGTSTLQSVLRANYTLFFGSYMVGLVQKYLMDIIPARKALNSIFQTLEEKSLIDPLEDRSDLIKPDISTFRGKIEFRDVEFSYPTNTAHKVFDKISFVIEPGQRVAFVGSSGSGKSTLIQLIERFYDISSGNIFIDDIDIQNYHIPSLRKIISLVGQEPALFKRSIYENIQYGNLNATKEEIEIAAEISKIKDKLDYQISDNNEQTNSACPLSGGEKQRVAIARALIRNPKILFLDEATSALDANNECEIQKLLEENSQGRTTISIAHRLSTVINCDVIYVLEKGKIVEHGSHKELCEKGGLYLKMLNFAK